MLKEKYLDDDEKALAIVLRDPIFFAEFLRNTNDASTNEELYPKTPFRLRWYQRDLLTDTTPYISVMGGRAIGKCMSYRDTVYTDKGYVTHQEIAGKTVKVWAITPEGKLALRRAYCFRNGRKPVYKIKTQSGNIVFVTRNHPLYTGHAYVLAEDLSIGDTIQSLHVLPHVEGRDAEWAEMRWIGYTLFRLQKFNFTTTWYHVRNNSIKAEMKAIAKYYDRECYENEAGALRIEQTKRTYHPMMSIIAYYKLRPFVLWGYNKNGNKLSKRLMELPKQSIQWLLEALYAQFHETLKKSHVSLRVPNTTLARQIAELLLRFGIRTTIQTTATSERYRNHSTIGRKEQPNYYEDYTDVLLATYEPDDAYRFWNTFTLPGYTVQHLPSCDPPPLFFHDPIVSKELLYDISTFALQVDQYHTYIGTGTHSHNSLVVEDRILFELFNAHDVMHTPEILLTTPNTAQMTPIADRINMRALSSPLLRHVVDSPLNANKGTMDWIPDGKKARLFTRIAGSKDSSNVIGLHVNRIRIDEAQIYPLNTFDQLKYSINQWEPSHQVMIFGVSSGLTNAVLYRTDKKIPKYKKYRIPSPNNPYFTKHDFEQALRDFGGIDDDRVQQLVLARHGTLGQTLLHRDALAIEPHDFFTFRYTNNDKAKGIGYKQALGLPVFSGYDLFAAGIDTGFVDPTIISVLGYKRGKWYSLARYRLQRIEFPEQEIILHWLHMHYGFAMMAIDVTSGGQGASLLQNLIYRPEYKPYKYHEILLGVHYGEMHVVGYNEKLRELKADTKTIGTVDLVRLLTTKTLVLSEIDNEGISELERITKRKTSSGQDQYYVMSENGNGAARSDHIYASMLCFAFAIRDISFIKPKKKLGKTQK